MKVINASTNLELDEDLWTGIEARFNAIIESSPKEIKQTWSLRRSGPYHQRLSYIDFVKFTNDIATIGMDENCGYTSNHNCRIPNPEMQFLTVKEALLEFPALAEYRDTISNAQLIVLSRNREFLDGTYYFRHYINFTLNYKEGQK
jgi:hypothetical protein